MHITLLIGEEQEGALYENNFLFCKREDAIFDAFNSAFENDASDIDCLSTHQKLISAAKLIRSWLWLILLIATYVTARRSYPGYSTFFEEHTVSFSVAVLTQN